MSLLHTTETRIIGWQWKVRRMVEVQWESRSNGRVNGIGQRLSRERVLTVIYSSLVLLLVFIICSCFDFDFSAMWHVALL